MTLDQLVKILVSIRSDANGGAFRPCVEIDVALEQSFAPTLIKPMSLARAVSVAPDGPAQIEVKARFAADYEPHEQAIDLERLKALFVAGWDEFMNQGGVPPQATLPDVDLGYSKLRAENAGWTAPEFYALFAPAGIKITNSSDKTLVYQTKGPYSDWSSPYTLKSGGTHDFPIAYPMLFRRKVASGYQMYTLPAGSHSEFRTKVAGTPEDLYKAREPDEIARAVEDLPAPAVDKAGDKKAEDDKK